jgi:hypothetical protein
MTESEFWRDLIEAAEEKVRRASDGDPRAAAEILELAAVVLRGILKGRSPDPEELVYLASLEEAITLIVNGAPPEKALGLRTAGRPVSASFERDLVMFWRVGRTYEELKAEGRKNAVQLAQEEVANCSDIRGLIGGWTGQDKRVDETADAFSSLATVVKAWQACGGLKNWSRIKADLLPE